VCTYVSAALEIGHQAGNSANNSIRRAGVRQVTVLELRFRDGFVLNETAEALKIFANGEADLKATQHRRLAVLAQALDTSR
jgi:hypothetical protein